MKRNQNEYKRWARWGVLYKENERERRNHQQNKTAYFIIGKIVILTILLNSQKHHASESMCKM